MLKSNQEIKGNELQSMQDPFRLEARTIRRPDLLCAKNKLFCYKNGGNNVKSLFELIY